MPKLLSTALLVAALSLTAASQPFPHQDQGRHSDFTWNSRKIGNKKVATLTIRKDEERDRRSIPLAERDDSGTAHRDGQTRHPHRHHHGEGTRAAMWLANEQSLGEHGEGRTPYEGHTSEGTGHRNMSPLYVAESGVEDNKRVRHNDVHLDSTQGEDHMPSLSEILEEAGTPLNPSLLKKKANNVRRGSSEEGRGRRGKKSKRNRTSRRNRNNRVNRRKQKGCRRLKGESKRNCLNALRQCRSLKKRKKKKCRADVLQAALDEDPDPNPDLFSFLKNITEMSGTEACHYHYLKKCCTRAGLFTEGPDSKMPVVKCHFRKEFLKCMQHLQERGTCDPTFHTRGDMAALRKKIKEFVWTPSSCLISDAVEG